MLTMAAVLAAIVASAQWHFKLDTTFRTQITQRNVNALHLLPDGGIFLSGLIRFSGDMSDRGSAKLLSNGQRDQSFPSFPQTTGGGRIIPWIDGKFYVSSGLPRRLTPEGLIDPTFSALFNSPYFSPGSGGDYHVFEDGRVLITGNHYLSDSIRGFMGSHKLIWFSNEGYLDTTRVHRKANGAMWNFTALPDGKFLCSCSCTEYEGQPVGLVFRVHADGELDTSFVSDIDIGSIIAYHTLPDGRIYLGGRFRRSVTPEDSLHLVRLMPNGGLDPSFTPPSFGTGDLPGSSAGALITFIHPWENGNLIVTGKFRSVGGAPRNSICMIDSAGSLLPLFHDQGVGIFQGPVNTNSSINHIAEDDMGRLYIAGTYTGYNDGTINDTLQRFVSRLLVEEDLTVAVQEEQKPAIDFSMHPNPASGTVTFNYSSESRTTGWITIRDLSGRVITTIPMHGQQGQQTWNTTSMSPGTYSVEYIQDGQLLKTEKLIVQR